MLYHDQRFALLFMAVGLIVMLFVNHPALPEFWDGLSNTHADPDKYPIFPCLFITIACGAISGFHATQSPLMARCIKNERYGRPVFYGSMITEGVVALVWAAAATYFYHDNPANLAFQAPQVVTKVCSNWMGALGSILALAVCNGLITAFDVPGRQVLVARVSPRYAGAWMMHCHITWHEAAGMLGIVEYEGVPKPEWYLEKDTFNMPSSLPRP